MTEPLRCSECGIADERVLHTVTPQHPSPDHCLAAALALLEECRPYMVKAAMQLSPAEARAILAKLPPKE